MLRAGIAVLALLAATRAHAQSTPVIPADPLARPVSLSVDGAPLHEALTLLRRDQGVIIAWSGDMLPRAHRVTVSAHEVPLRDVLDAVLRGTDLEIGVTSRGTIVVMPRLANGQDMSLGPSPPDSARIARAVSATGVHQLDQVVVMGSVVAPSPEREQPTAVGVVGQERTAQLAGSRITDVIRRSLPGVILWDRGPAGPPASIASVRGVSSFTTRALKTYVDGVEVASPELFTLIDARAVQRIELIRGPQGAALYGPDALNGILQIETRRGRIGGGALRAEADAAGGTYQQEDLGGSQPSLDAFGSVQSANGRAALAMHAGYSTIDSGASALMRSWSAQAGGRLLARSVMITSSARVGRYSYAVDPLFARLVPATASRDARSIEERAVGVQLTQQVTDRWQHTLVAGQHAISGAREASRSPLLPPRLPAGATHEDATRTSIRYGTSVELPRRVTLSGGVEHSRRVIDRAAQRSATSTDLSRLYRDDLHSTGAFAQARLRIGSRLVISGGSRAEDVSSVASDAGLLWAHTAGATWSREFDWATLRLRGAWGEGIRPPEPGMNRDVATPLLEQEANPALEPERQRGYEAGLDLFLPRGSALNITWYDQRATDLIQQVQIRNSSGVRTYQFQNVGVVRNSGLEVEASHRVGPVTATGIMHLPRSEVLRVAPGYAGELQRGDRLIEVPEAAGSAALRYDGGRLGAEIGVTWLGEWTGYDWFRIGRTEQGQSPEPSSIRGYWFRYPGLARPYLALDVALGAGMHGTLRVDNPANTNDLVRDNVSPRLGRHLLLGFSAGK